MIALRDYQKDCVTRTLSWLRIKRCNPLVVVPTGGGKSLIIADLCKRIIANSADARIIIATHVKELVRQNHDEIQRWWPEAPLGLCSVGLGHTNVKAGITVGTIQTLYARSWAFGKTTHLIVDEAHMIPRDERSRYRRLLSAIELRAKRRIPMIGLTASPYRLDSGLLHQGEGAIFDTIAANVPVSRLVREGFLAPLVNQPGQHQIDTTGMIRQGADFTVASMQAEIERQQITRAAIDETIQHAGDRKSWLVFAVSIRHGEEIAALLNQRGIAARMVSSQTNKQDRDSTIQDFRAGRFRALVSVNILTTGFNVPQVDLIALLRPTLSTALYVQMLGRGMRCDTHKRDCLVLDFGGNIDRHGPLNRVQAQVRDPILQGRGNGLKSKVCPTCEASLFVFSRTCPDCGHLFSEIQSAADLANPVLDPDIPEAAPPHTPAEIVRHYLKAQRVNNDPFMDHLMTLRGKGDEL